MLMNHRTRTDWNFIWPVVYHCVEEKGKLAHSTKFILKDPIKHIPGPGKCELFRSVMFLAKLTMIVVT